MTYKLATALLAGTLLAGCASTMADDNMDGSMQTSASTDMSMPATTTTTTTKTTMKNPMVGGAAMLANRNIVQNASAAPTLTTLVKAVTAADLGSTLSGPGPFTVFAPTNDAFDRAPAGLVSTLMMPENKALLQKVLKYHVVSGKLTAADLMQRIKAGGGTATLTTVEGETLNLMLGANNSVMVMGKNNSNAYVITPDVMQSNGVVHVINGVLAPTLTP